MISGRPRARKFLLRRLQKRSDYLVTRDGLHVINRQETLYHHPGIAADEAGVGGDGERFADQGLCRSKSLPRLFKGRAGDILGADAASC